MSVFSEGGPRIINAVNMSWHSIKQAYRHGFTSPEHSLFLGQQYASHVAGELHDSLAIVHAPYDLIEATGIFGKVYTVEGMGSHLGTRLRRNVEVVPSPKDLPVRDDWIALSGGQKAVITSSTIEAVEYLEALLASRNTPRGRQQLREFLYEEGVSLAHSDGKTVFVTDDGRYLHPDNMFSALARHIEPIIQKDSERRRRPTHPVRRGNLVLVQ